MKTKFYWAALLASAAMIAQANAGGRYGGGGGGFVARHSADWHRDWDRGHRHFHHGHVFVFIDGFWWGLDPGYYAYDNYPYDDYGYANNGYPYDYYQYSPYNYDDEQGYAASDQDANNATVSAVQSKLAKLGYYRGAIDRVAGDKAQAAPARYQEEHELSVTGTLTAATL